MVVFVLRFKADIENVEEISFPEHAQWCLNLKQSDGDEVKEGVYVSSEEEIAMSGSRGVANFVMKYPGGSKEVSLNVQQIKGTTRAYTLDDSGSYVPIVAFECRGWYESTSFCFALTVWSPSPPPSLIISSHLVSWRWMDGCIIAYITTHSNIWESVCHDGRTCNWHGDMCIF